MDDDDADEPGICSGLALPLTDRPPPPPALPLPALPAPDPAASELRDAACGLGDSKRCLVAARVP